MTCSRTEKKQPNKNQDNHQVALTIIARKTENDIINLNNRKMIRQKARMVGWSLFHTKNDELWIFLKYSTVSIFHYFWPNFSMTSIRVYFNFSSLDSKKVPYLCILLFSYFSLSVSSFISFLFSLPVTLYLLKLLFAYSIHKSYTSLQSGL